MVILGQSNDDDEQQDCSDLIAFPLIEGKSDHMLRGYWSGSNRQPGQDYPGPYIKGSSDPV